MFKLFEIWNAVQIKKDFTRITFCKFASGEFYMTTIRILSWNKSRGEPCHSIVEVEMEWVDEGDLCTFDHIIYKMNVS